MHSAVHAYGYVIPGHALKEGNVGNGDDAENLMRRINEGEMTLVWRQNSLST